MRSFVAFVLILGFSMAGCISGAPINEHSHGLHDHHEAPAITASATKCIQGGGNSVYPMTGGMAKIGPFDAADQNPEVGNPVIGAYGAPVTGPSSGIWHVAVVCDSWEYNGTTHPGFQMGWVAQMIKRPSWDVDGPALEFMVADLSFNDDSLVSNLLVNTGIMVSKNLGTTIELSAGNKIMHNTISDEHHGVFEYTAELHKEFAKKTNERIRFWMLVATDGSHHHGGDPAPKAGTQYRPIAIDIVDTADGSGVKLAGESAGVFTHIQDLNKPGENHYGNPLGHLQTGFSRTITLGPMPEDILFNQTWLH